MRNKTTLKQWGGNVIGGAATFLNGSRSTAFGRSGDQPAKFKELDSKNWIES